MLGADRVAVGFFEESGGERLSSGTGAS